MAKRRPRGTGGLRFDSRRGLWVGRVIVGRHESGKPRYREVTAKSQAACLLKMGTVGPASAADTVGAWADRWLAGLTCRASTRDTYTNAVRVHVLPALGDVRLADLRPSHVKTFTVGLLAAMKPGTARHVVTTLRTMLDAAVAEELIPKNVAKLVAKPRVPAAGLGPYTPAQLKLLVGSWRGASCGPIVALLAACGCRLGEAAALDVADFDGTRIRITKTYREPHGIGPPKSERGRRTITVPVAARPALVHAIGGRKAGVLFPRPSGRRYTSTTLRAAFRPHCKRLGLPLKRSHFLRHSVITALVGKGWPLADVARYAGDAVETIVKVYVHPSNRDPVECLDELFGVA